MSNYISLREELISFTKEIDTPGKNYLFSCVGRYRNDHKKLESKYKIMRGYFYDTNSGILFETNAMIIILKNINKEIFESIQVCKSNWIRNKDCVGEIDISFCHDIEKIYKKVYMYPSDKLLELKSKNPNTHIKLLAFRFLDDQGNFLEYPHIIPEMVIEKEYYDGENLIYSETNEIGQKILETGTIEISFPAVEFHKNKNLLEEIIKSALINKE